MLPVVRLGNLALVRNRNKSGFPPILNTCVSTTLENHNSLLVELQEELQWIPLSVLISSFLSEQVQTSCFELKFYLAVKLVNVALEHKISYLNRKYFHVLIFFYSLQIKTTCKVLLSVIWSQLRNKLWPFQRRASYQILIHVFTYIKNNNIKV